MARVLIVDDDANNRLLLRTLLAHANHHTIEAATGTDALRLAEEEALDLIVVDLSLPDMPGPKLIANLRAHTRTANTKLALYTATRSGPALDELMTIHRIDAIIPKPGDPKIILDLLATLIGGNA